jgi:Protein of unknown function (DUF3126)
VLRRQRVLPVLDLTAPHTSLAAKAGVPSEEMAVDVQEVKKLDAYLKKLFGNQQIRVVPRPKKDDSAEVYVGEEFIGVLFVDDEDDDRSYNFQMAILSTDLD